jgi:hypothetical protein
VCVCVYGVCARARACVVVVGWSTANTLERDRQTDTGPGPYHKVTTPGE